MFYREAAAPSPFVALVLISGNNTVTKSLNGSPIYTSANRLDKGRNKGITKIRLVAKVIKQKSSPNPSLIRP